MRLDSRIALTLMALVLPLTAQLESPSGSDYSEEGALSCLTCHGADDELPANAILATPHAIIGDSSAPFGEGRHECETCHGPSAAHMNRQEDGGYPPPDFVFGAETPVDEMNAVCLDCHQDSGRFHWPGSTHDIEGVACTNCHSVHAADDTVLALETQSLVCFQCHQEQSAEFLRQSRHPVQAQTGAFSYTGMISCTDCHSSHGSAGAAMLIHNTVNQTCYECHAEKRGPFLWEHQPVREDCATCHAAHGSNYENLLLSRQPWMCQQCHAANFHPSGVYSGTGIPPAGADQRILGKQCLNCHPKIHGTNHPSGVRLTR